MKQILTFVSLVQLAFAGYLSAQPSDDLMRQGDAATLALRPAEALNHYENILRSDSTNFEALWKASMCAIDLGEFENDKKKRDEYQRKGELLARRAVALQGDNAEGHFHLSRALGIAALSVGVKQRVNYARDVRDHAMLALKYDPNHAGALHVMGVWNAEVMRLSFAEKLLAKAFLGAGFFSQASWADAQKYMEKSAAVDPNRLTHHLDLARVYRDRKMHDQARASYKRVIDGKVYYFNDEHYKRLAAAELAKVGKEE